MKIRPIIEGQCVIVPAGPVMCRLSEAGGPRLKVLLYILASPEFDPEEAAEELNITVKSFNAAIEYWVKAGAIECDGVAVKAAPKKQSRPKESEPVAENVTVKRPR